MRCIRNNLYVLLVLTLCVAACIASSSATPPSLKKVAVAQFGKEKFLLYLPFYIAMEEGFFAKQGIEIDLIFAGNDEQIFATVISGDASFGLGDPVFAAISREKGGPGKIVGMMVTKLGLSGYTKNPKIPEITTPQDAKGLRIGSLPSPSTTFTLLEEFIKVNDLAKSDTVVVQAAIGGQLALLEAGLADIAVDLEPSVSIVESKGYRVNFSLDRFTETQAITGISTLESTIKKDPELVQKLVSGLQEALVSMRKTPEVNFKVAQKLFPTLSKEVIQNALKPMLQVDMYPHSVKVLDEYWQRSLKTRLDSGELKIPQKTDFTVDNSFAEAAEKEFPPL